MGRAVPSSQSSAQTEWMALATDGGGGSRRSCRSHRRRTVELPPGSSASSREGTPASATHSTGETYQRLQLADAL